MEAHFKNFGLKNFRVFKAWTDFEFAPITILTGTNSSGKSSILGGLNFLKESLPTVDDPKDINIYKLANANIGGGRSTKRFGKYSNLIPKGEEELAMIFTFEKIWFEPNVIIRTTMVLEKDDATNNGLGKLTGIVCTLKGTETLIATFLIISPTAISDNTKKLAPSYGKEIKLELAVGTLLATIESIQQNKICLHVRNSESTLHYNIPDNIHYLLSDFNRFKDSFGISYEIESILKTKGMGEIDVAITSLLTQSTINVTERFLGNEQESRIGYLGGLLNLQEIFSDLLDEIKENQFNDVDSLKAKMRDEISVVLIDKGGPITETMVLVIVKLLLNDSDPNIPNGFGFNESVNSLIIAAIESLLGCVERPLRQLAETTIFFNHREEPRRIFELYDDPALGNLLAELAYLPENNREMRLNFVNKWLTEMAGLKAIKLGLVEHYNWCEIQIITKDEKSLSIADLGYGVYKLIHLLLIIAGENLSSIEDGLTFLESFCVKGIYDDQKRRLHLVEEPESNLHPALQSKLADLFVDAAKNFDTQFIIETHSEYLIRKLQYLTAKGEIKPEDTVIYYFYPPDHPDVVSGREPQVKKINILPDGSLSGEFGSGFFDEADNIALELFLLKKSQEN